MHCNNSKLFNSCILGKVVDLVEYLDKFISDFLKEKVFVLFSFKLIILPSNSKKEYLLFFLKIIPLFAVIICDSFFFLL